MRLHLKPLIFAFSYFSLVILILLSQSGVTFGLSAEQKAVFDSGIQYFNVEDTDFCQTTTPSTPILSGNVYMIGDSITNAARTELQNLLTQTDLSVVGINSDPGRAISYDSSGGNPTGLQAIQDDSAIVASADGVIVALGTNSGNEDLNTQIPAIISAIRNINPTTKIYWVNLFYTSGTSRDGRNSIITSQASILDYSIIDTVSAGIELQDDGVHPTASGNATFAATVVKGLQTSTGAAPTVSGGFDPLSLTFPTFVDEQQIISGMKNYITQRFSRSPFARNLQYVDQIFTLSKQRNVNPLLVMAIARQENGFGQAASSATAQNNYFGITQGNGYRSFPTVEAGIDYFVEKVGRHVANPTGPYAGLTNFYEYLSIHQVGLIAYPGEYPENAPGKNSTPPYLTYDVRMDVYTSWDESRNSHKPGSPVYNPGIYYKNSIELINTITGLSLPDTPNRGANSSIASGLCPNTGGSVSTNGYAFPLAPQRKIPYGSLPCNSSTNCHHDNTPAFDLSYAGVEGKSVYAIIGGTIDRINTQDPGWCQSIQLKGNDGFFYWYGHVIDVSVSEGQVVTVGQEIAKVANWEEAHDCNGTSGGPHLHIDRGCVLNGVPQRGGSDSCRDQEFVPFMKALYESLPN